MFIDLSPDDIKPMEQRDYSALPKGLYNAVISEAEMKMTKDGSGQYLKTVIRILTGPYKGRQLFENFNIFNKNEQTVAIAKKAVGAICAALGYSKSPDHPSELLNKPLNIRVTQKKDATSGELKNGIDWYGPYGDIDADVLPGYTGAPATPTFGVTGASQTTYANVPPSGGPPDFSQYGDAAEALVGPNSYDSSAQPPWAG